MDRDTPTGDWIKYKCHILDIQSSDSDSFFKYTIYLMFLTMEKIIVFDMIAKFNV